MPPEKPKPIPVMRGKAPRSQTNMSKHSPLACILGSYPNMRLCLIPQYALSSIFRSKPVRSYGNIHCAMEPCASEQMPARVKDIIECTEH
jgi:hypothetical protein